MDFFSIKEFKRPVTKKKAAYLYNLCHFPDEALATEYVRTHTSVPVPKVLDVVQLPAGSVHTSRSFCASEHQVQRVCEHLRDWITQLRNLQSPSDQRVCGFTGGSSRSLRIGEGPNKSYNIHFVHGDLLLHNILADSDLRPTGIIDWECAAWMPDYWETVSSSRGHYAYMWRWKDIRRETFTRYEAEVELDRAVQISRGE
ncbi:hypothetical protein GGX14DRAFT_593791 [Mycena pura]|uniref:Aminoglycoside phosphotransferase domain-containing protein n=1 Tax=Mycena pura TaxID=153505 RepID=A0AAD6UQZ4_9AGAR|nr:hypothetical protein GGX14DRAFT_593791 [Mycena pura]